MNPETQKTVLICEDEPIVQRAMSDVVEFLCKHPVMQASSATEALEIIRADNGKVIGILLSDNDCPGPNEGVDLIEVVRQERPDIYCILMTGRNIPEGHQGHEAFTKPARTPRIAEAMNHGETYTHIA